MNSMQERRGVSLHPRSTCIKTRPLFLISATTPRPPCHWPIEPEKHLNSDNQQQSPRHQRPPWELNSSMQRPRGLIELDRPELTALMRIVRAQAAAQSRSPAITPVEPQSPSTEAQAQPARINLHTDR